MATLPLMLSRPWLTLPDGGAGLGPALSLPNMLVIRGILGTQKTAVYCGLVVVMATFTGWVFGLFYP